MHSLGYRDLEKWDEWRVLYKGVESSPCFELKHKYILLVIAMVRHFLLFSAGMIQAI